MTSIKFADKGVDMLESVKTKPRKIPRNPKKEKVILGWREWITLPDFSKLPIKAKVDTGAKTSALHAKNIEMYYKQKNAWVSFELVPSIKLKNPIIIKVPLVDYRTIKSSMGHRTHRPVIKTLVRVGTEEFEVEFTLVNRSMMGFRMLLGRQAIKKRFLVNPSRSFFTG